MTKAFWDKALSIAFFTFAIYLTAKNLVSGAFDWLDYLVLLAAGCVVGFVLAAGFYSKRNQAIVINTIVKRDNHDSEADV